MRTFLITLSILVLGVIAMTYLYFSNLNKDSSANDNSLNLVTVNSGVVFTFENDKSFYDILSGQTIIDEVLGERKSQWLAALRKNIILQPNLNTLLEGEKIYVGLVPGQNKTVDFLIVTQSKIADIDATLLTKIKSAKVTAKGDVHQLTFPDSTTCFVSLKNKSILIANTLGTLTTALTKEVQKNDFAEYVKLNNRFNKTTLANVYLDYNKISQVVKNIIAGHLNGELAVFNKQDTYAALSYNFGSDKLLLNGYTELRDKDDYLQLFVKQPEQKITVDQFLPQTTANYTLYNVSDYTAWREDLNKWFKGQKAQTQIAKQFKTINEKYRIDVEQTFPANFQNQFAVFQLSSGEKLGIIALKNGDKLSQLLLDLSTEYSPEIRSLQEKNIPYHFFGAPFKNFERPFYTIIDNHFVFANYASSIQAFLNSYNSNQLLANAAEYIHLRDQISNSASIFFYINNKNSANIFNRNLRLPYYKQYKSNKGFGNYNAFAHQLSADNGKFMSNILLLKKQKTQSVDSLSN